MAISPDDFPAATAADRLQAVTEIADLRTELARARQERDDWRVRFAFQAAEIIDQRFGRPRRLFSPEEVADEVRQAFTDGYSDGVRDEKTRGQGPLADPQWGLRGRLHAHMTRWRLR